MNIANLPKLDLHCHLDGSLTKDIIEGHLGRAVSDEELTISEQCRSLTEYLRKFDLPVQCLQDAAGLSDGAYRFVEEIAKEFGRIDILVNNAGITKDTLLMRMTEEQWDAVINVNLKSVFNFTKAVSAIMLKQKSGSIISMSSVVGVSGNAGQANYSASKAGIIGFTKSVAKELGSRNIRANAVAPGFIITDMTAQLPEDVRKEWAAKIPLRRGGTPEDIADVCTFLASDMSRYVTGQVIHVCGGMNM